MVMFQVHDEKLHLADGRCISVPPGLRRANIDSAIEAIEAWARSYGFIKREDTMVTLL